MSHTRRAYESHRFKLFNNRDETPVACWVQYNTSSYIDMSSIGYLESIFCIHRYSDNRRTKSNH